MIFHLGDLTPEFKAVEADVHLCVECREEIDRRQAYIVPLGGDAREGLEPQQWLAAVIVVRDSQSQTVLKYMVMQNVKEQLRLTPVIGFYGILRGLLNLARYSIQETERLMLMYFVNGDVQKWEGGQQLVGMQADKPQSQLQHTAPSMPAWAMNLDDKDKVN